MKLYIYIVVFVLLHRIYVIKADPKRVKKALPKILKGMKQDDRVMIIGVTKSPFGEY